LRRIVEERAPVRDAGRSPERLSLEEIGRRELEKQQREMEKQRAIEVQREREHQREHEIDPDPGLEI
jgi:hypothetical protein